MAAKKKTSTKQETFQVNARDLLERIKEIIHQGNVRRIIIKNKEGKTIIEIPVTLGVVGALLLPQLAALGAITAFIAEFTITVEREV